MLVLMRIDFKFQESLSPDGRKLVIEQVRKLGAEKVEAMFPEEKDAELASLYKVEGIPKEQLSDVAMTINEFAGVEYAEVTPEMRMIH